MIVEKGHLNFAEKYWGDQRPPSPPCSDGLVSLKQTTGVFKIHI